MKCREGWGSADLASHSHSCCCAKTCCSADDGECTPGGDSACGGGACAIGSEGVAAGLLGMVLPVVLAGENSRSACGAGLGAAGGTIGIKRAGMGAAERSCIGTGLGAAKGRDGGRTPGGSTPGGSKGPSRAWWAKESMVASSR